MSRLQSTKVVRPEKPREPVRRIGIVRLGKVLALGLLLTTTTAAIGLAGETVLGGDSQQPAHTSAHTMASDFAFGSTVEDRTTMTVGPAGTAANQAVVETSSAEPVVESGLGTAFWVGTVLFWLGLAAANLRRQGVKDYRSDNRSPSGAAVLAVGAARS